MIILKIILIILGVIYLFGVIVGIYAFIIDWKEKGKPCWKTLGTAFYLLPTFLSLQLIFFLRDVWEDGGCIRHWIKVKKRKHDDEQSKIKREAEAREYKRIKELYLAGKIKRSELPRIENGEDRFEFASELNFSSKRVGCPGEIVYVENKYCSSLNSFFVRNKNLRLFNMYKFVYLPNLCKDLMQGDLLHYLYPDLSPEASVHIDIDSTYPIQFLEYHEDIAKIKHGMMYFYTNHDNHGAKYTMGHYYPLEEGDNDYVTKQLDAIVRAIHNRYGEGGFACSIDKPQIEEGSTDDYADDLFPWIVADDNVLGLIKEIRDKINALKELGIGEKLIFSAIKEKPKLSRLVITKDYRLLLPDYNGMEIKMEPLVKAVYLLFLKHPEGIVFKCLPDYREELLQIYVKMKPYGISDRVLQSIEDVTNPCLNSINEKCARIRGAFISHFDGELAFNYIIYGFRSDPKKISLPRDLVIWEE